MPRLIEIILFLLPFAAFALWRATAGAGGPSVTTLAAAAAGLMLLAAALIWFGYEDSLDRGQVYVPAQLENGRILPGHAAPP